MLRTVYLQKDFYIVPISRKYYSDAVESVPIIGDDALICQAGL